jgi:hypothetical protein
MFENMPPLLIITWSLFTIFAFYQKLHIRDFRGASQGFLLMLNLSAFGAMIFAVIFLIYYGITVKWFLPIILLIIGLVIKFVWFAIEAQLKKEWIPYFFSILGFIGWPICAVIMIICLPKGA